jgi:NAD(P)H dehydrogenase (quinone)
MKSTPKILIICGHPDKKSYCGSLAKAYASGAKSSGANVKVVNLGELKFDPILWEGYKKIQKLEPDLIKIQDKIKWANHLVFVYPIWWLGMPAIMKGLFDRAFLPSFAFKYHENGLIWDKLLKGRSARIIVTMDSPLIVHILLMKLLSIRVLKKNLSFFGVGPIRSTMIGSMKFLNKQKLNKRLNQVNILGKRMR